MVVWGFFFFDIIFMYVLEVGVKGLFFLCFKYKDDDIC